MTTPRIDVCSDHSAQFVQTIAPEQDSVQDEMSAEAASRGDRFPGEGSFPTVGPTVGAWLYQMATRPSIDRIFEFGSGFGYSAYWMARALSDGSELVLTERDQDELALAQEFLERGEFPATIRYEQGEALPIFEDTSGKFDLVLLDHKNDEYPEAIDALPERLSTGGFVLADNVMTAAIIQTERLLAGLQEEPIGDVNPHTKGVYDYLKALRADPAFATQLLPIGGGLAVSQYDPKRSVDARNDGNT